MELGDVLMSGDWDELGIIINFSLIFAAFLSSPFPGTGKGSPPNSWVSPFRSQFLTFPFLFPIPECPHSSEWL